MSNLALKNEELNVPEWDYFVSEIQKIYRLTDEETSNFTSPSFSHNSDFFIKIFDISTDESLSFI